MLGRLPPLLLVLLPSQALDTGEQNRGWEEVGRLGGRGVYGLDWDGSGRMETGECVGSSINTVNIVLQQLKHPVRRCFPLITALKINSFEQGIEISR